MYFKIYYEQEKLEFVNLYLVQLIRTTNLNNQILFVYLLRVFLRGESCQLISKYTKNANITVYIKYIVKLRAVACLGK